MCAINGIIDYTESNNLKNTIDKMNDSNSFRGPDDSNSLVINNVALGHNLLQIRSNINEIKQPYVTKNKNVLIYNGECYEVDGFDTTYVAEQFEKRKINFLKNMNGHFALCFYDTSKHELTIARDHFGTKPLFYTITENKIVFSSTIHGIISANIEPKSSLVIKEGYFLKSKNVDTDYFIKQHGTWYGKNIGYENIFTLIPGEYITFSTLKNKIISRGSLFDFSLNSHYNLTSLNSIKELIIEQIKTVSDSDKEMALGLSGGIDSGIIGSVLKNQSNTQYITIMSTVDTDKRLVKSRRYSDDWWYAQRSANKYRKYLNTPKITFDNNIKLLEIAKDSLLFPALEPVRISSRVLLAKYASTLNAKILLGGEGADEIFTGYSKHSSYYKWKNNEVIFNNKKIENDISQYLNRWKLHQNPINLLPTWCFGKDKVNNALLISLFFSSSNYCMVQDQLCGYYGIESRPCFLTIDFVKTILSIPSRIKLQPYNNNLTKFVLRKCFEKDLDIAVLNRKVKSGFAAPAWKRNVYDDNDNNFSKNHLIYAKTTLDVAKNYSINNKII